MRKQKKIPVLLLFVLTLVTSTAFSQKKEEVSHAELVRFAETFIELQTANKKAQQEMVRVVENTGLSMKRFNEIHKAYVNYYMTTNATKAEQKKHLTAMNQIKRMQEELRHRKDSIVRSAGFSPKRYREIAFLLRDDMDLRAEYNKIMKEKQQKEIAEKSMKGKTQKEEIEVGGKVKGEDLQTALSK